MLAVYPIGQRATPDALGAAQVQRQTLQEKNRPGFDLDSRPIAEIFDGAVANSANEGEGQFIAYDRGAPDRGQSLPTGRKFAGEEPTVREILISQMDQGGGLASIADNKKNPLAQDYFRTFAERAFDSPMNGTREVA